MAWSRRFFLNSGIAAVVGLGIRPGWGAAASPWTEVIDYHRKTEGSSLMIRLAGQIVAQDGDDLPHELASGTKSFWGTLALILEQNQLLQLSDTLGSVIEEWSAQPKGLITLQQLLTLSSGLDGSTVEGETGLGKVPTFAQSVSAARQIDAAGQVFHYGPTPFQVFGEYLRRRFRCDPLKLAEQHIFKPANLRYHSWKRGSDGQVHLPSGARLTAKQWLNFGTWILGQAGNFSKLFQGTAANPAYGLTWWLNRPVSASIEQHLSKNMRAVTRLAADPTLAKNIYVAAGLGDQRLFVIPEWNMVVSRQAGRILSRLRNGGDRAWSDLAFLQHLSRAYRAH